MRGALLYFCQSNYGIEISEPCPSCKESIHGHHLRGFSKTWIVEIDCIINQAYHYNCMICLFFIIVQICSTLPVG